MEDLVISENIEVIVLGNCNEKFIEKILLNTGFRTSPLIDSLITQNKEFLSLFLAEAGNLTSSNVTTSSPNLSHNIGGGQQNQTQIQTKTKSKKKNYFKNVNKLLNFSYVEEENENVQEKQNENPQMVQIEKGITYLTWADFKRTTSTISTKNFWININFNLVSDMFLDPYINNFVTANINLLVFTFEMENELQRKKAVELYKKLATSKPPSSIKYQSQMLLLQSGYYQAFNDNIVLALCELPEIEQIGPCCLIGFGKNDENLKLLELNEDKCLSKIISFEENGVNGCVDFYEWILKTHQQIKYSTKLDDENLNEILKAVRNDFSKKNKKNCCIF